VQYTGNSDSNVAEANAITTLAASDLLARGPENLWSIAKLKTTTETSPNVIHRVTIWLVDPHAAGSATAPFDVDVNVSDKVVMRLNAPGPSPGLYFFQNPLFQRPALWVVIFHFPNGHGCSTPFCVT
jgi:hypothetical protein